MPVATDRISRRATLRAAAAAVLGAYTLPKLAVASGSRRATALVIGSSKYAVLPGLPHAETDARLIAGRFSSLGMNVDVVENADRSMLMLALAQFRLRARESDLAVFYFAGHGLMEDGMAQLVPTEFDPAHLTAADQSVPISTVLRAISDRPRTKVLFLDACRTFHVSSWKVSKATASVGTIRSFAPGGTHITYASELGDIAYDGAQVASPFALALARALREPGLDLEETARQVRRDVVRQTGGRQIPWSQSSLLSRVTLGGAIED